MKRRTFLTASSTIGLAGVAPGAFVSSLYGDFSTSILLEEFDSSTKSVLDRFLAEAVVNFKALGLDEGMAKQLVLPVKITSKKSRRNNQEISYKNRAGEKVSISVLNGVERIGINL